MNRRGFALLSVLWTITILSAVAVTAMEAARIGMKASTNRIQLARAEWARAACVAILEARFALRPSTRQLDTADLGRGTWCVAGLTNPHTKLNLNLATRQQLWRLFRNDSLVAWLRDWIDVDGTPAETEWYQSRRRLPPRNGPLAAIEELLSVRGFDSTMVARLTPLVTTDGEGRLDPGEASPSVIEIVLGVSPDSATALTRPQLSHQPPSTLMLIAAGGVHRSPIVARGTALKRVSGARLVTLWQEMP